MIAGVASDTESDNAFISDEPRSPIRSISAEEICALFESASSKEDVVRILSRAKNGVLQRIPLVAPTVDLKQVDKDFRRERVFLNDVPFIPDQNDENRASGFARTLRQLIQRLQSPSKPIKGHEEYSDSEEISNLVMKRACRTSAGADSFFMVQRLLCVEGTFVSQKTYATEPPIRVDVFLAREFAPVHNQKIDGFKKSVGLFSSPSAKSSSTATTSSEWEEKGTTPDISQLMNHDTVSLCARVEIRNSFAIYDESVMDELTGVEKDDPPPWLDIDAVVIDESNFKTGQNFRRFV